MKTNNNNPAAVLFGLDWLLNWFDEHPRTAAALLWIEAAAFLLAVFSYRFTTAI